MTATVTSYLESSATPRRTLAEAKVLEIQAKVDDFDRQISRREQEIMNAGDMLRQAWRTPESAAAVANDLEAMHRAQRLARQLRDAAVEERAQYERQIVADRISAVRAEVDALMTARTAKARDLVAATQMACALIQELETMSAQALALFSGPAIEDGLTMNTIGSDLNRFEAQGFVEELFAQTLPPRLWRDERPIRAPRDVPNRLPDAADGERTAVLARIDLALERTTMGLQFGADASPAEAAAASYDATLRRAQAGHHANAREAN